MRGATQIEILKLLRKHDQLSRADLANKLKMNRGNITRAISQMVKRKWLTENKERSSDYKRGQPPTFISINPDAFTTVGISISSSIHIVLLNASGELLKQAKLINTFNKSPEDCIAKILDKTKNFISAKPGINIGILVVSAGTFTRTRESSFLNNFYLASDSNGQLLKQGLEALNAGPIVEELIANVYPLAELQARPHLRDNKTVFCITDRLDLGGLWEGKMISGVSKSKISVKHMKIGKSDQDCYCHRKGCLVLSASIWSIMDRYYGYQPGERGIQAYNIIENERNHMFDLIRKEDPILMPIIKSAAKDIADAIENLAVIFRPDAVFFNSWLSINRENGIDIIKKQFEDYATINKQAILECDIITHGEIQGAVGAAVMIIENNFGDSTPHLRISDFTKLLD